MTDIGYVLLVVALIAAVYSAIAFVIGRRQGKPALVESGRNAVLAVCGLLTLCVAALLYLILTHSFQVEYIASYSSRGLPLTYLLSSLWAGNEGSVLFWAWVLSILAAIMVVQKRDVGADLVPYAGAVTMLTETFFLVLLLFVANPFRLLPFTPPDGNGLNPLLQNPGMFFHPPFLLGGYVGFTIPFAFAVSALLSNRLGDEWLVVVRRWTLVAWIMLSIGNLFGGWWAYVELGWGGYFAWDPVENASFMPWLTATAFLHSMMMQRRRGILKVWNIVLIVATFALSILGTFLTRSGVLNSVHSFASSPLLGSMYLGFIAVTLFGSLYLLYLRFPDLRSEAEMESLVSRESTFLLNNLLLVGATFAILLGTFFPIISEAVRGVKVSVGPPFFNWVNGPIFLAVVLLAGVCTLIGWRRASLKNLRHNFLWPGIAGVVLAALLFALGVRRHPVALLAFTACGFVVFTIVSELLRAAGARHRIRGENILKASWGLVTANRPRYGGYLVHIGVVLMAIGIVGSQAFNVEREATLKPGESVTVNRYVVTYDSHDEYQTQNKSTYTAALTVSNGGHFLTRLAPQKYFYADTQQTVTEVAIRSTWAEDLYVIPVGTQDDGTATFKVIVNPLVKWLWTGGTILVLGGVVAFWPNRRKAAPAPARAQGEHDGT